MHNSAYPDTVPGPVLWYSAGIALALAIAGTLYILALASRAGDPPRYTPTPFSALWAVAPYVFLLVILLGARRSRARALVVVWASAVLIPFGIWRLWDGFFVNINENNMWFMFVPLYQAMGCAVAGVMLFINKMVGRA